MYLGVAGSSPVPASNNTIIMKKILSYLISFIFSFGVCWFGILSLATPYSDPGRWRYIVGFGVCLLIATIFAGIGISLPWKKVK